MKVYGVIYPSDEAGGQGEPCPVPLQPQPAYCVVIHLDDLRLVLDHGRPDDWVKDNSFFLFLGPVRLALPLAGLTVGGHLVWHNEEGTVRRERSIPTEPPGAEANLLVLKVNGQTWHLWRFEDFLYAFSPTLGAHLALQLQRR